MRGGPCAVRYYTLLYARRSIATLLQSARGQRGNMCVTTRARWPLDKVTDIFAVVIVAKG